MVLVVRVVLVVGIVVPPSRMLVMVVRRIRVLLVVLATMIRVLVLVGWSLEAALGEEATCTFFGVLGERRAAVLLDELAPGKGLPPLLVERTRVAKLKGEGPRCGVSIDGEGG